MAGEARVNRFTLKLMAASLALTAPVCAQSGGAPDADIISGDYDSLLIGFDPATRIVSGYFQESTGRGQFSCIFYLTGTWHRPDTPIRTWFPGTPADVIKGALVRKAKGRFRVDLSDDHGGCWNVRHFADKDQPAEFDLETAHPWISIAVVKSDKAWFFDAPGSAAHRKAYVVQGDGLGVRAIRGQWLQVDFVGGSKPVSGWIRTSDVYPAR